MKRLVLALLLAAIGIAQDNSPHSGYVYPAGVKQGESVEVVVGGQRLNGVRAALVTGAGIDARIVRYDRPLNGTEAARMRDELRELNQKRPLSAEDKQHIGELRDKLEDSRKRNQNPAVAERITVAVTVASDAPPGERELRLSTPNGVTNPLVFEVGRLPEVVKTVPQTAPVDVRLPVLINGQIAQGGVDRYRFEARAGQSLVVAVSARKLIPYISDAVPGWFQASITLRDARGVEVAFADHYRFDPDPVLHYEVPAGGAYTIEIRDSIYRGREDFVYRMAAGELPYLTDVFPLGGKVGVKNKVEFGGWNLPVRQTTLTSKTKAVSSVSAGASNVLPFPFDALPEMLEKEPNDVAKTAQAVKLPVIVNGRIGQAGDVDLYRFKGRAGDEIVAEVTARRLGSPLDSMLRLLDAKGREIAVNDDAGDRAADLQTHQADSRLQVRLPAGGTYYLQLTDAQRKSGSEYAYRLRISRPMPDFELRVTPSSVGARAGQATPLAVYALRRDGFAGDISLALVDAPAGFGLDGALIPAGQDRVDLTLSAPARAADAPVHLSIEGRATVAGREVRHLATAAEDQMQAFAYHHLVPSQDLLVQVTAPRQPTAQWKAAGPVRLPMSGVAEVKVQVSAAAHGERAEVCGERGAGRRQRGARVAVEGWGDGGVAVGQGEGGDAGQSDSGSVCGTI